MKGKNLFITALVMLLAGIVLIILRNSVASGKVVIACGILFMVAGLANMFFFLGARDRQGKARAGAMGTAVGWFASGAAVILGLAMLLFRSTFEGMVAFMFAALLLFGAVFQLCLLVFGSRPVRLSGWFYIFPMALTGLAIYIYTMVPGVPGTDRTMIIATGAGFIIFGAASIIEGIMIARGNHLIRKQLRNAEKEAADAVNKARKPEPESRKRAAESAGAETTSKTDDPETDN